MLQNFLLAGAGGALGAMLRFGMYKIVPNQPIFIVTLLINIIGSFLLGLLLGWFATNEHISNNVKVFLAVGLCGGFTTFSTFSSENMTLLIEGKYSTAALYISASVLLGIFASFFGFKIIQ